MEKYVIRPAEEKDAARLLEIYAYYIEETAVTFEWEKPSLEEFKERIRTISKKYPYLVVEEDSRILGYVYVHPFSERKAYDWTLESSVYVDKNCRRCGLGHLLYEALEEKLIPLGIKNLIAKVAYCKEEDEYLTHASVIFHEKSGYKIVGCLEKVGQKFDRWYDIMMMQKVL